MNTKIAAKIGEWVVILSLIFGALPYYINTEVERRVNELSEAHEPVPLTESPPIVELSTKVDGLTESLDRTERKVDEFSRAFIEYLQREAQ